MTKQEAKQQVETFFRRLGNKESFFDESNFFQARIGEAFVGFEYDELAETLHVQALIYRFRNEPREKVLDAIFAEESDANTGGGRIVLDGKTFSLFIEKEFVEPVSDEQFNREADRVMRASLDWSREIFARAAEKANN